MQNTVSNTSGSNAQGTLAATAGSTIGAGLTLIGTTTGQTQVIGLVLTLAGVTVAVLRAWLRSP